MLSLCLFIVGLCKTPVDPIRLSESLVVQWLGYMTLTHEIRVQFPARENALALN